MIDPLSGTDSKSLSSLKKWMENRRPHPLRGEGNRPRPRNRLSGRRFPAREERSLSGGEANGEEGSL